MSLLRYLRFSVLFVSAFSSLSLNASESCTHEIAGVSLPSINLQGFIHKVISSSDSVEAKLAGLRKFIGLRVKGERRFYAGSTQTKREGFAGKVLAIDSTERSLDGLFAMSLETAEGPKQILFSHTISPAFSSIEVNVSDLQPQLRSEFEGAAKNYEYPFHILAIGLDTELKTRIYKEALASLGVIAFYGKKNPFYEFSNFYVAPIIVDGLVWPSSEHYFQALKFLGSEADVMAVRAAKTPAIAAAMGRDRSKPLRPDWEVVKDEVMYKALVAKFTQHKHLYDVLMSTGEAELVEHTERDKYWGDAEDGSGKAMLGTLLVRLRTELRDGTIKLP